MLNGKTSMTVFFRIKPSFANDTLRISVIIEMGKLNEVSVFGAGHW